MNEVQEKLDQSVHHPDEHDWFPTLFSGDDKPEQDCQICGEHRTFSPNYLGSDNHLKRKVISGPTGKCRGPRTREVTIYNSNNSHCIIRTSMNHSGIGEVEIETVTLNPQTGFCSSTKSSFSVDYEVMKDVARACLF